jgi:iron complex transport system ATP-binding protein
MKLEAIGISARLGRRTVLSDVGLAAESGGLTGLVGPNGAGKSTLLRVLAGLVAPVAGQVLIDGVDLLAMSARERARRVAYLPQSRHVEWSVSVETLVGLGRLPHRGFGVRLTDRDRAIVQAALREVDAMHLADRPATELSGGELARVLTARALAQEPQVLLADEPMAGLDPAHALALFEHLRRRARAGACVVLALHDLTLALRFCERLVLLKDGRVLAAGPAESVLTPATIEAGYGIRARCEQIDGVPVVVPLALA